MIYWTFFWNNESIKISKSSLHLQGCYIMTTVFSRSTVTDHSDSDSKILLVQVEQMMSFLVIGELVEQLEVFCTDLR